MEFIIPLIPILVLLYGVGRVAEAIRLARGTVFDDLNILEASIKSVRTRAEALPPEIVPEFNAKLKRPVAEVKRLRSLLETAGKEQHKALRLEIASALALVSEARSIVDKHCPQQDEDDEED